MNRLGIIFIIAGLVVLLLIVMIMIGTYFNFMASLFFLAIVLLIAGIIIYLNSD